MPDEEDDEVPCLYCGSLTRNQDEVCDDSSCQAEAKEQWVSATREDDHEADRVDRALGFYR